MENVNDSQSTHQTELGEVIHELQRGLNSTSDLHTLIQDISGSNAQNLIEEIKGCFSRAMTSLSSSNQANHEFVNYELQLPYASSQNVITPSNSRRSRSRVETTSQEKILTENPNDCYAWRIYGQKEVPNSIYPRVYYECAHKDELNCCATKRVRHLAENPSWYEIVNCGQHTCMQLANGIVPN